MIQLGFPWIFDNQKLYCWQRFIKLFYPHLKDVEELESFYFELLNSLVHRIEKQNPKRAIIEAYVKLCEHEGRLHTDYHCLLCEEKIVQEIALVRSLVPIHPKCSYSKGFKKNKVDKLFREKSTLGLNDSEIEQLWNILLQGL